MLLTMAPLEFLEELATIEDRDSFIQYLDETPEALEEQTLETLRRMMATPAGPSIVLVLELLTWARDDPNAAFANYQEKAGAWRELAPAFERHLDGFYIALKGGSPDEAVPLGEAALNVAILTGQIVTIVLLRQDLAKALASCRFGDLSSHIDRGIEHLEAAGPFAFTDELRASIRADLGALWGRRIAGDPDENRAIALTLTRQALLDLDGSDNTNLRATIESNLSKALIAAPHQAAQASRQEALAAATRGVGLADISTDADHWAHCQINLAAALEAGLAHDEVSEAEVIAAYRDVTNAADSLASKWLAGYASRSVARVRRRFATSRQGMTNALADLHRAVELIGDQNGVARGQTLIDLGDVQWALDDRQAARKSLSEALELLPISAAPTDRRDAAFRLGGLLVELSDEEKATVAYEQAVEAADHAFHARTLRSGREQETISSARLYRWAAATFHKLGKDERAIITLETGRAREMRSRLFPGQALVDELTDVPSSVLETYLAAISALRTQPLRGPDSEASRDLSHALASIRAIPGNEEFGKSATLADVANAAAPGWPILYINPSPTGTSFLAVSADQSITSRFVPTSTSGEIWQTLVGRDPLEPDQTPRPGSYLACAAGQGTRRQMQAALDHLLPWLGERLGPAVVDLSDELEAEGLTIVPCGPLSLVPLAVIDVPVIGQLIDKLCVRFAPSAAVMATCVSGRDRNIGPRLVALAGPELKAAAPEVRAIADGFENPTIATGEDATGVFLRENGPRASHLHVACHAQGGLHGFLETWLRLADGDFLANDIAGLALTADVAVASACQTASPEPGDLGDESYSLASALVGAGSACAVASLWSVPDIATAFLMVRFYEALAEGASPPQALRDAQRWVRKALLSDYEDLVQRHPALQEVLDRLRRLGPPTETPPYAGTAAWAAFLASGA